MASDLGLIHKGGAWYTFTSLPDKPKFQGTEKARQYLVENDLIYQDLVKTIKITLGIE